MSIRCSKCGEPEGILNGRWQECDCTKRQCKEYRNKDRSDAASEFCLRLSPIGGLELSKPGEPLRPYRWHRVNGWMPAITPEPSKHYRNNHDEKTDERR